MCSQKDYKTLMSQSIYPKGYRVPPRSRREIESQASILRRAFSKKESSLFFPLMPFLEHFLYELIPGFSWDVRDDGSLDEKARALTLPEKKIILIEDSVYNGAVRGIGKDRMTVAHEIGHLLLHQSVPYAKKYDLNPIKTYESSEWQADVFAGELLAPICLISGKGIIEIAEDFGVSPSAAKAQLNALKRFAASRK